VPLFLAVDSPFSNLIKEVNSDFVITVTMNPESEASAK